MLSRSRISGLVVSRSSTQVLVWCLAPVTHNGSDTLFAVVVAPAHWLVTAAASVASPPAARLLAATSHYVTAPLAATIVHAAVSSLHLASVIAGETPGGSHYSHITCIAATSFKLFFKEVLEEFGTSFLNDWQFAFKHSTRMMEEMVDNNDLEPNR